MKIYAIIKLRKDSKHEPYLDVVNLEKINLNDRIKNYISFGYKIINIKIEKI